MSVGIGVSGETELTSYCFLSSVTIDHSGVWLKLRISNPPIILASVVSDADFLAVALGHDADRARQLVFDRQATVEERDDHFLDARGEGDSQEDLGRRLLARSSLKTRRGSMPNRFSASWAWAEIELGRHEVQADLAAAPGLIFLEQAEHVGLDLDVVLRHLRAVVRLDQHGPVGRDALDQFERLSRQRVQPLGARVRAHAPLLDHDREAEERQHDRGERAPAHGPSDRELDSPPAQCRRPSKTMLR